MAEYIRRSRIAAPAAAVFAWHQRPDALERLIPPWEPVTIEKPASSLRHDGATSVLKIRVGPVRVRWVARHSGFRDRGPDGGEFTDTQVHGPFEAWEHTHRVIAAGDGASILEDRIRFELPMGRLGSVLGEPLVRRRLDRMFDYRHGVVRAETERGSDRNGGGTVR